MKKPKKLRHLVDICSRLLVRNLKIPFTNPSKQPNNLFINNLKHQYQWRTHISMKNTQTTIYSSKNTHLNDTPAPAPTKSTPKPRNLPRILQLHSSSGEEHPEHRTLITQWCWQGITDLWGDTGEIEGTGGGGVKETEIKRMGFMFGNQPGHKSGVGLMCSHCGEMRHLKQWCYEIIDYPDW